MHRLLFIICCVTLLSCNTGKFNSDMEKTQINETLDNWHKAAGKADFENYFGMMSDESVFIGTDATENWNKADFMVWSKPYFNKGKAWNFTSLERNIYFGEGGKMAWFDELLNTQMKICRGSGVVVKEGEQWKIKHYVLSVTVPNEQVDSVVSIKSVIEDALINKLQNK